MKIMAVCGSGLGSSFMLEMNIKKVLTNMGIEAEVEHSDLSSVTENSADLFVMAKDIAMAAPFSKDKIIILNSIISKAELEEKLKEKLK